MKIAAGLGRRALIAAGTVAAVLASLVVAATPAAAAVTAPGATLSQTTLYRGQPFTVSYGDIFCDGAPSFFDRIEVGVAGAGQTSIYTGITEQSSLHVPTHAPIGTNSVLGVVSSGPCTGQVAHFATFEVIGMQIDVNVAADAALYRPSDTATITATIGATGNPGQSLDGRTARFLRDGTPIGTATIVGGTAVLHGVPVGAVGWHHLEVHVADWELGSLNATPYEVAAIPVTLTATGPAVVPAGTPATFTVAATSTEGIPNLGALTATVDRTPVAVDVAGTTATIDIGADELTVGAHTLAVTLPAVGDFEAATTTLVFDVERHTATLHAHITGPVIYGAPFNISVQATSVPGEPLDGTVSATVAGNTLAAPVAADGSATIAVPAGVAAHLYTGLHTFPVTYDGGSSHQSDTATASTTIGVAPTDIEVTVDSTTAGAPLTATITVTAEHGTPDGYVSFHFAGVPHGGTMLLVDGAATVTLPAQPAGTHVMSATYWGTGGSRYDYAEITTSVLFERAATTTAIVTSVANPTSNRTSEWTAWACTAIPNPDVTATPTNGTEIEMTVHRDGAPFDEFTVAASDRGTCFGTNGFSSDYPAGEYTLHATFPGDMYLAPSTGTAAFTVEPAATAMTLTVDPDTTLPRAGTVFTATLSAPGSGRTHGGTVTLTVNGNPKGTATVDPATNTATFTVPLDAGAANVAATYSGDEYHEATSVAVHLDIDQRLAEVSVTVTPPTVTIGEASTFTATVTTIAPPVGGAAPIGATFVLGSAHGSAVTPTGTVTFLVNGNPVGTAPLIDGVASLNHTFAAVGSYTVTAAYSGDANTAPVAAPDPTGWVDPAATAAATVVAPPDATPPTEVPAPDTPPASPALPATNDGNAALGAPAGVGVGTMAHTGSDAATLLSLAAVLLVAGTAGTCVGGRRRRRFRSG